MTVADLYGSTTTEILVGRKLIKSWISSLADSDLKTVQYWLDVLGEKLGMSAYNHLPLGRALLLNWWLSSAACPLQVFPPPQEPPGDQPNPPS